MTRRNLLISAGLALLVVAAWYLLLWSPKGGELEDVAARRAAAEDRAEQLEVRLSRLQAAQEESVRLIAVRDRLRSAVPEKPDVAQFVLDANDAATAAGVDFVNITPAPPGVPTTPGAPTHVGLGIKVEGGYFQVLDYLDRLLELPRVVVIDTISVTPMDQTTGTPKLAVDLTARMFTALAAAPAAESAQPISDSTVPIGGMAESVAAATDAMGASAR